MLPLPGICSNSLLLFRFSSFSHYCMQVTVKDAYCWLLFLHYVWQVWQSWYLLAYSVIDFESVGVTLILSERHLRVLWQQDCIWSKWLLSNGCCIHAGGLVFIVSGIFESWLFHHAVWTKVVFALPSLFQQAPQGPSMKVLNAPLLAHLSDSGTRLGCI